MSRKPLTYSFTKASLILIVLSLLLLAISCAPKVAAPPRYLDEDLSLDEILLQARDDIRTLKAVADISIEKNSQMLDHVNASVLIQGADRVHMRVYKFGMLVHDLVMTDGVLYDAKGKSSSKFAGLISEFARSVFWWEHMKNGSLRRAGKTYIIHAGQKEIHLDSATLLPIRQEIITAGKHISVSYAGPRDYDGFWQPSELTIAIEDFRFRIKIERLVKNPPLAEADFAVPSGK